MLIGVWGYRGLIWCVCTSINILSLDHPPTITSPISANTSSLASLSRASRASMPRDPSRDNVAGQAQDMPRVPGPGSRGTFGLKGRDCGKKAHKESHEGAIFWLLPQPPPCGTSESGQRTGRMSSVVMPLKGSGDSRTGSAALLTVRGIRTRNNNTI